MRQRDWKKKRRHHQNHEPYWSNGPKWWRNMTYHRRMRRASKHYCYVAKTLHFTSYDDCEHQQWNGKGSIWDHWHDISFCWNRECIALLEHSSDEIPIPVYKEFKEWWD